jgi:membrane protein implicated in regulation of membrane protease activity
MIKMLRKGDLFMHALYWLIIIFILIFVEILTLGLTTIWFAGGALAAFVISMFYENFFIEIIIFLIVSLALLYFTRPMVLKYFNPKRTKTNYEGVIGKTAIVISTIDNINAIGQVRVDGQEWSAKSITGNIIEKGVKVKVEGITGVKLIVSIIKEDLV